VRCTHLALFERNLISIRSVVIVLSNPRLPTPVAIAAEYWDVAVRRNEGAAQRWQVSHIVGRRNLALEQRSVENVTGGFGCARG
jgi:hypothetical protein